ncbi:MAG: hypothetical protein AAFP77_13295 [Bacteroidota bacterium]
MSNVFKITLFATLLISCNMQPSVEVVYQELADHFNSKGRYARFVNSSLLFGDTLTLSQSALLKFDSTRLHEKFYRKAAYQIYGDPDSIIYFMYGLSRQESILDEVRIRSFKRDSLRGDFLIIDLDKYPAVSYDYRYDDYLYDDPVLIVQSMNEVKETHYSFYAFREGAMINETIVPDTIFKRHDLLPSYDQGVKVYDDFKNKTLTIGDQQLKVKGRITEAFRGEDCQTHIIVRLDKDLSGFRYIYFDERLSDVSNLYGLHSDSLIEGKEACLKVSGKPYEELTMIKEEVYFEY